jgi:hypothetical protein
MAQPELDRLIINNLADLDAAAKHVQNELEPAIDAALDSVLEPLIRKAGWAGAADRNKKTWLVHDDWRKQGDHVGSDFECQFDYAERSKSEAEYDFFWLTKLLGIGFQNVGLRWKRNDVKNKKQWKSAVGQQPAIIAQLRARGFEYEQAEASFFLPVRIDQRELAQAVADESPGLALTPFNDALKTCVDAKPHFDALLKTIGSLDALSVASIM